MDRGQAGSLQEGLLGKGIEACRSPVAGPARVQGVLNFKEVRCVFSLDERERSPFLRWKFTCCTLHHVRRCASAPGIVSNKSYTFVIVITIIICLPSVSASLVSPFAHTRPSAVDWPKSIG